MITKEISGIVRQFKKLKIRDAGQARSAKFKLRRLGSGAFREAYLVNDAVIVKFPINDYESNIYHSQKEIEAIRRINKQAKYRALRPFIPEIYFADYRHGILIVEQCFKLKAGIPYIVADILGKLFETVCDKTAWASDIENYNVMENINGDYKVIDLGLF